MATIGHHVFFKIATSLFGISNTEHIKEFIVSSKTFGFSATFLFLLGEIVTVSANHQIILETVD